MPAPRLIVGLGNPGAEYEDNRHNVGFWFIDALAHQLNISLASQSKFQGIVGRAGDLWLLKPMTFMNRSGRAVLALANFYKILPDEILVVHDELDLAPGDLRLKAGGGHGGHNGLKDIIANLSVPDFWRLRIGIGHPGQRDEVSAYVLKAPRKEEALSIDEALTKALAASSLLIQGDYPALQRRLHTKPPKSSEG